MRNGTWNSGHIWITNGKTTKHIPADRPIPEGFYRGRNGFRPKPIKIFRTSTHPLYGIWSGMMARCYNKKSKQYGDYGGRGIQVTFRWRRSFICFAYDVERAIGKKPTGRVRSGKRSEYIFDRIDNDGHYRIGNVKWSTWSESNHNKRGARLTVQQRKEIEQLLREGVSCKEIHKVYGAGSAYHIAERLGLTKARRRLTNNGKF